MKNQKKMIIESQKRCRSGTDFTKSNEWTGTRFGDASTHDQEVFSFYPDDKFSDGFEDVLRRYRELVPQLRLAGLFAILFTG
ncbi:hypothetical protein L2E82_48412 [Cichorium intybus]|uniref:Uncharacterized protein n=1 Tax=Cichorium intybus TaxID=13427 RepID=A0ACB8YYB7_CICIN|nr:hypothetical protein L2E82_48412 [Cichorium intybus]